MSRTIVFIIIQALCAVVLSGGLLITVLALGHVTSTAIIGAIGAGFVASFPVAWLILRRVIPPGS